MEDAAQTLITECLEEAIEIATTEDGISPGTDLYEDDEARHSIGEQAFVCMTDTYEEIYAFVRAQDILIVEYMTNFREDFPDSTDEIIQEVQGKKMLLSDLAILALGYRAAERFKQNR